MKPDAAMVMTSKMAESLGVGGASGFTSTTNTLTPTTLRSITQIFESDDCLQSIKRIDDGDCNGGAANHNFVPPAVPPPASVASDASRTYVNLESKSGSGWNGGSTTVLTPSKVIPHIAVLIQDGVDEEKLKEEQEAQKREAEAATIAVKQDSNNNSSNSGNNRPRRSARNADNSSKAVVGRKSLPSPPSSDDNDPDFDLDMEEEEEHQPKAKRARNGGGRKRASGAGGRRRPGDEHLSQEEFEKISVRRARNKEAAARCRKRRVDLTNTLLQEVEGHEATKRALEEEIQLLKAQKEELEFVLQAHAQHCKLQAAVPSSSSANLVVAVKSEPAPIPVSVAAPVVVEAADAPYVIPETVQAAVAVSAVSPRRPASLSIATTSSAVSASESGIVISTPSAVVTPACLSFDSVTTGLTPSAPTVASIATPTVAMLNTPCSQQKVIVEGANVLGGSPTEFVAL